MIHSIYYAICDGGESKRQFINIKFSSLNPVEMNLLSCNKFTEDPMIFLMDCKVYKRFNSKDIQYLIILMLAFLLGKYQEVEKVEN